MRVDYDEPKRQQTLAERGLDMRRAGELFAGWHFTREDTRRDYAEPRFISIGELDRRVVVLVWTPRGTKRRIISMRKANVREQARYAQHLAGYR